ncbi:hypothetical protein WICMUC_005593 [Wickerhamomyces mucosus]|uniref:Histone deacetylase n=1 Tax=Wickerhamomyces mucosus TaxID=1378264 RepID=A0A9P8P7X7_9ASCO|nr:hypothetical protein WICMUC_005593 [Wickerhamomyces mucosus]
MENSCVSDELNKFRNEVIPEILKQPHSVSSTNQMGFPPSSPLLNSQVQRKVSIAGYHWYETELTSLVPSNLGRSNSIYNMLKSYNEIFNKLEKLTIKKATKLELCKFHDEEFVNFLLKKRNISIKDSSQLEAIKKYQLEARSHGVFDEKNYHEDENNDIIEDDEKELFKFGLKFDCPLFPHMDEYIQLLAGSTLSSCRFLMKNHQNPLLKQPIAINWNGGRHHGKRSKAAGFCYINDISLAILELRKTFSKIVYIDLDLHHGDGVENSFSFSDKIMTLSVHRKDLGFFPGTGGIDNKGKGKGLKYSVNIPLKHGLSDRSLLRVIDEIIIPTIEKFKPDCMVIQCGGDGLSTDDFKEWNLSIKGYGEAIKSLLSLHHPVLMLGGGGYNNSQMARLYTYLTTIALDIDFKFDILPDDLNDEDYEFWNVHEMNMIDENNDNYIDELKRIIGARYGF